MTSWYDIAEAEIGQAEIEGAGSNDRIRAYLSVGSQAGVDDSKALWCADFCNWVFRQAEIEGTGSSAARSFLRWGRPLEMPRKGCIVVLRRGDNPEAGHVGFFVGMANDKVMVLGGNQANKVCILPFPESMVLGYRWPEEAPLATAGHELHHAAHGELEDSSMLYWVRDRASKLLAGGGVAGSLLSLASGLSPLDWVLIGLGVVFVTMVALQLLQLRRRNAILGGRS